MTLLQDDSSQIITCFSTNLRWAGSKTNQFYQVKPVLLFSLCSFCSGHLGVPEGLFLFKRRPKKKKKRESPEILIFLGKTTRAFSLLFVDIFSLGKPIKIFWREGSGNLEYGEKKKGDMKLRSKAEAVWTEEGDKCDTQ